MGLKFSKLNYRKKIYLACGIRKKLYPSERIIASWVEKIPKDKIFYDVGANVGVFSMIAARNHIKTYSFEPSALNFYFLIHNIIKNGFSNKITPINSALSDCSELSWFYFRTLKNGGSNHSINKNTSYNGERFNPLFSQLVSVVSIDDLVSSGKILPPSYIKIDVDGVENLVIKGAQKTLKNIKEIFIENVSENYKECVELLVSAGFKKESFKTNDLFKK